MAAIGVVSQTYGVHDDARFRRRLRHEDRGVTRPVSSVAGVARGSISVTCRRGVVVLAASCRRVRRRARRECALARQTSGVRRVEPSSWLAAVGRRRLELEPKMKAHVSSRPQRRCRPGLGFRLRAATPFSSASSAIKRGPWFVGGPRVPLNGVVSVAIVHPSRRIGLDPKKISRQRRQREQRPQKATPYLRGATANASGKRLRFSPCSSSSWRLGVLALGARSSSSDWG